MIRGSWCSKSRLVKAAGAESCGQRRNQKLHAAVAQSTFPSENVQNTSAPDLFLQCWCRKIARTFPSQNPQNTLWSDHFMKFRCRKIARRWREAHFQVKIYKTPHGRTTLWTSDVEKLHAAVARSIFVSQNVQNTCALAHFLKFRCRNISQVVSQSINQSVSRLVSYSISQLVS